MISRECYLSNLELALRVSDIEGCIVECGVWRGGMIAGIASVLGPERTYYLFDSFEGLPPAQEIDGQAAIQWQADKESPKYYQNCRAEEQFASAAMKLSKVKKYKLIRGWFEDTIPKYSDTEPIALLRLDGDWYDSTMICLKHLFDRVVTGGLIIIDDYYTWDGCSRAVHDFLSERSAIQRISSFNNICLIKK